MEHTKADNEIERYDKSQLLQGKIKMGPAGRRRKRSVTPGIGGKKRRSSSKKRRRRSNGGVDYVGGVALQVTSVILNYTLSIHMISTQFDMVWVQYKISNTSVVKSPS